MKVGDAARPLGAWAIDLRAAASVALLACLLIVAGCGSSREEPRESSGVARSAATAVDEAEARCGDQAAKLKGKAAAETAKACALAGDVVTRELILGRSDAEVRTELADAADLCRKEADRLSSSEARIVSSLCDSIARAG
jgi:hypothetical protein